MKRSWQWLFSGKSTSRRRTSLRGAYRPALEALESRLPLVSDIDISLDQGTLLLEGTPQSDNVEVYLALAKSGDGSDVLRLVVHHRKGGTDGERFSSFDPAEVRAIMFRGHAGNDHFVHRTNIALTAFGGPGDDKIYGGISGNAEIHGEGDHDTLIGTRAGNRMFGGPGNDVLFGLEGNDVLYGGPDKDTLWGYEGADVLFGGSSRDDLFGGEDPDFLDGGRDFTPDLLSGEWRDGFADRASDVFVHPTNELTYFAFVHPEDRTMLDRDRDYEAVFASNPGSIWSLLGVVSSGFSIDDSSASFAFLAEDHDISLVEFDWETAVLPVDDYFIELAAFDLESLEDISWSEQSAAEQEVLNDVALLALLADEQPSILDAEAASFESDELVEPWEVLEFDPMLASEGEFTDNELLATELPLLESYEELVTEETPIEELADEYFVDDYFADEELMEETFPEPLADESFALESYYAAWSSSYVSYSWAWYRW